MTNEKLEVEAANAGLLAPTAAELMTALENGEDAELNARIKTLGQRDFIQVLRAVRQLDSALSSYAMSWRDAECWGQGVDFPA